MNEEINPVAKSKPKRQRPTIDVLCTLCGKRFVRQAHHHKYAVEHNQGEFCGKRCRNQHQTTSVSTQCAFCSRTITVQKSAFDLSRSKHFFCGHACSASYNNKKRGPRSVATRSRIKETLNARHSDNGTSRKSVCPVCDKEFKLANRRCVCCSKRCGTIYKFGFEPYSKNDIVNAIVRFLQTAGRTPMRRELKPSIQHAAAYLFGSWNKAIESCGLKTNGNTFRHFKIRCSDGHLVRSLSEKIIDEWLTHNGIAHEIEKPYPVGRFTCDFYLPASQLWVEYFGMTGAFGGEYDETTRTKIDLAKVHGLNLISLFPEHLYPECKLDQMIHLTSS